MNDNLKKIAEEVRIKANIPEEEEFGSVIAILMVISIILTVIRVIQECNKTTLITLSSSQDKYKLYGAEIRSYSIKKSWWSKLRLKKLIKKRMSKEQYQKYGLALQNSIFDTGVALKDDEIVTLVEAANV